MTPGDVHAAAEHLVEFPKRFAPLFGRRQGGHSSRKKAKGPFVNTWAIKVIWV